MSVNNLINNKINDLSGQYVNIATSQGLNIQQTNVNQYNINAGIIKDKSTLELGITNSKHGNLTSTAALEEADGIITSANSKLTTAKNNSQINFNNQYSSMASLVSGDYNSALTSFFYNTPSLGNIPTSGVMISSVVTNLNSQLTTLGTNLTNSFIHAVNSILNNVISSLNRILAGFNTLVDIVTGDDKKIKDTKYNFYQRAKGASSTSSYIQANVPNKKGILTPNPRALENTPDKMIVNANLKSFSAAPVVNFPNPLAAALGKISSLIPSIQK